MPLGSGDVVVITGAGLIVRLKVRDAVARAASVRVIVKLAVPVVVGVPEMTPDEPLSDRPVGSGPPETDHVRGVVPPVPTRVVV
jgi:hypothetical protein